MNGSTTIPTIDQPVATVAELAELARRVRQLERLVRLQREQIAGLESRCGT